MTSAALEWFYAYGSTAPSLLQSVTLRDFLIKKKQSLEVKKISIAIYSSHDLLVVPFGIMRGNKVI